MNAKEITDQYVELQWQLRALKSLWHKEAIEYCLSKIDEIKPLYDKVQEEIKKQEEEEIYNQDEKSNKLQSILELI